MSFTRIKKDPQAFLDYFIDWSTWKAEGDTLTTATWSAPDGLSIEAQTVDGSRAVVWLAGGTAGQDYTITCHAVFSPSGREDDRSLTIQVRER